MGTPKDMGDLYRSIAGLMVLHNLCIDYHDTVDGLADDFTRPLLEHRNDAGSDDEDEDDLRERVGHQRADEFDLDNAAPQDEEVLTAGRIFRDQCVDLLVPRV